MSQDPEEITKRLKESWAQMSKGLKKQTNTRLFGLLMHSYSEVGKHGTANVGVTVFQLKILSILGRRMKWGPASKFAELEAKLDAFAEDPMPILETLVAPQMEVKVIPIPQGVDIMAKLREAGFMIPEEEKPELN